MPAIKLKRNSQQHNYGLRTKSDYVPPEETSGDSNGIAQKAAMLMFQKQQQAADGTTAATNGSVGSTTIRNGPIFNRNNTSRHNAPPSQSQTQSSSAPLSTTQPIAKTKSTSLSAAMKTQELQNQRVKEQKKSKYSIHSYATNKVININNHNKVTCTKPLPLSSASTAPNKKRTSVSSKLSSNDHLKSSTTEHTSTSTSSAALAAAASVAKSSPRAMTSIDGSTPNTRIPADEHQKTTSTNGVIPTDLEDDDQNQLRPINTRNNSFSGSSIASDMKRSPYSFVVPSNHRNSGQFSFNNSHSSLQLQRLSQSNKSTQSLTSSKGFSKSAEFLPFSNSNSNSNSNSSEINSNKKISNDIIPEVEVTHADADSMNEETQPAPAFALAQPPKTTGVVVTAPTPQIDGNQVSGFTRDVSSADNALSNPQSTTGSAWDLKWDSDLQEQDNLKHHQHPYAELLNSTIDQNTSHTHTLTHPNANANALYLSARNQSSASDLSQSSDYLKYKNFNVMNNNYNNNRNTSNSDLVSKKNEEEFLYQSPFSQGRKSAISESYNNNNDASSSMQEQQPRRKPPPPMFESTGSSLQPGVSSDLKRLSLSSDFDIEDSPQLSQHSFASVSDTPRQDHSLHDASSVKKIRKPPPPVTPSDEKRNSFLQLPVAENNRFVELNESQMTFDDEDITSINDTFTVGSSAGAGDNNSSTARLPQYPTYTSKESGHHHHPHIPGNRRAQRLKNSAISFFGGGGSGSNVNTPTMEQQYYFGASDHSNTNLNPATMSQTAILIPQHSVKLKTTMRKDKKKKEFNEDKPWKHHNDKDIISEIERKRYEGVWVANRELCMDLGHNTQKDLTTDESLKAAQAAASQKLNYSQLMHGIIVKEIFKRSRLPSETLKKIYNLVDHNKDGFLRKDEFVVGMWLIDQCLYGRKLPKQVDEEIWESVHHAGLMGVSISVGKKKKK